MKTDSLSEIMVPVQVVLGEREISLKDLASAGAGTIIEINSLAGEPVDLRSNNITIAKGEVVVIDENFGIRLTEICGRE